MLEIKVKKKLGRFTVDVTFSTGVAGVTSLFGRSGAGKTSVINMVAGLIPPDEGRITVRGRKLFDSSSPLIFRRKKGDVDTSFKMADCFPILR